MNLPTERTWLKWLAGAVDPGVQRDLRALVAAEPALAARLAVLEADLRPREAAPRWFIPPPGVAGGRSGLVARPTALALDGGLPGPGDGYAIEVVVPDELTRFVVLLCWTGDGWQVLAPDHPDDVVTTAELPRTDDGKLVIDIILGEEIGRQRWAVALPEAAWMADWDAPETGRWAGLRAGMAAGEVPVSAVQIQVA